MTSLVLVFSFFSLAFPPQEADADHTIVTGTFQIFKAGVPFATFNSGNVNCAIAFCEVVIDIPKRFEALVKRDCGSISILVGLVASQTQKTVTCNNAKGPWDVKISVTINAVHGSTVAIRVLAV